MTAGTTTRPARPVRWLFAFTAAVVSAVAGRSILHATSGRSDPEVSRQAFRPNPALTRVHASKASAPGPGPDGNSEPLDPSRFRIVSDGVIEDTATGILVRTDSVRKGAEKPSLAVLTKLFALNDDLRADLREGAGPRPTRLRVGAIGVDADVLPIGLDSNRALAVPREADVTGWWSGGFVPGEAGPTVIVGHYDSKTAPGVFARLKDVTEGDVVAVDQSDGSSFLYQVTLVERLHKTAFPTVKVYGGTDASSLRLVTCGGKFDRRTRHYVDNVIAYAELLTAVSGPAVAVTSSAVAVPTSAVAVPTSASTTLPSTVTPGSPGTPGMTSAFPTPVEPTEPTESRDPTSPPVAFPTPAG